LFVVVELSQQIGRVRVLIICVVGRGVAENAHFALYPWHLFQVEQKGQSFFVGFDLFRCAFLHEKGLLFLSERLCRLRQRNFNLENAFDYDCMLGEDAVGEVGAPEAEVGQ
jgi:hypothetical protein